MHSRRARITYKSLRLMVSPLALLDAQLYMKFYLRVLCSCGMNFTGRPRYIAPSAYFDELERITLGDRVVVSRDVRFLTHDYSITTAEVALGHPPPSDVRKNGTITVADNVFVGLGAILLPNTAIAANTIIGAGSVVRGSIADHSVVIGNPARVIMTIEEYASKVRAAAPSWAFEADPM